MISLVWLPTFRTDISYRKSSSKLRKQIRTVLLSTVTKLVLGQHTEVFIRFAHHSPEHVNSALVGLSPPEEEKNRSFSLVTGTRTIDIIAPNQEVGASSCYRTVETLVHCTLYDFTLIHSSSRLLPGA